MYADHSFLNTLHETGQSEMLGNDNEFINVTHCDFSDDCDKDITDIHQENDLTRSLNHNCVFNSVKKCYLQNKKQFKVAHINVHRIRHNMEPFREVLQNNVFDILAIQETKIDDSFPDNQFRVNMYRLYRQDVRNNEGGSMMYVRDDIPQFRRSDIESVAINNQNDSIEILAIECKINNEKWLFISLYKQPKVKSDILNKVIDNIMMHYATDTYNVMILGDFTINLLSAKHVFIDCLEVNGL